MGPPIQDSLGAAADARDAQDAGDAQIWSLECSKIRSLQKKSRMFRSFCRFSMKGCDLAKMCLDVAGKVCKGSKEDCDEQFESVGSVCT